MLNAIELINHYQNSDIIYSGHYIVYLGVLKKSHRLIIKMLTLHMFIDSDNELSLSPLSLFLTPTPPPIYFPLSHSLPLSLSPSLSLLPPSLSLPHPLFLTPAFSPIYFPLISIRLRLTSWVYISNRCSASSLPLHRHNQTSPRLYLRP